MAGLAAHLPGTLAECLLSCTLCGLWAFPGDMGKDIGKVMKGRAKLSCPRASTCASVLTATRKVSVLLVLLQVGKLRPWEVQ